MITCKYKEKCADVGERCKYCKHREDKSYYAPKYPGRDIWYRGVGLRPFEEIEDERIL